MQKSITIEQQYPYSPDEVWEAITDPTQISDWLMHGTFQPRIGAEFEFYWSGTDASKGMTRGKVLEPAKIGEIVQSLANLPEPLPSIRRVQLWSHPAYAGLLVFLLGVFWVGRKVIGLI